MILAGDAERDRARDMSARLADVRARIAAAAVRSGRDPEAVTLVAVSKSAAAAQIVAALAAGVTNFGENRVADAEVRMAEVAALRAAQGASTVRPTWRFIGHLQSNKSRRAVAHFDTIDSVDSVALAQRLDRLAALAKRVLPILLEVNVAGDPARSGFDPGAVVAAAADVLSLESVRVDGLMAIAPLTGDAAAQRAAFGDVRALRDALWKRYPSHAWPTLSMGMSDDFEAAIEMGSTQVRIGRALFGPAAD